MSWSQLHKEMFACRACDRCKSRQIDAPFFGIGNLNADVMFIGESPGYQTRQKNGITFCGNVSGDYFLEICAKHGFHAGNSYFTNVVKCQKFQNEHPSKEEMAACKKYLDAEIEMVDPLLIVCVGAVAMQQIIPEERISLQQAKGGIFLNKTYAGTKIMAIAHPSFILRTGDQQEYELIFEWLRGVVDELTSSIKEKKDTKEPRNKVIWG